MLLLAVAQGKILAQLRNSILAASKLSFMLRSEQAM